ncbi:MAG: hypothetical protein DMF75_16910 [Acidobacteria bacterium]|nr:MAG: hypothetical protein DMF75_16910 [Acidobacteriota bacterium]
MTLLASAELVDSLTSYLRARKSQKPRCATVWSDPGSPNGYIFIFGLQHFAFFFLQQALLWFFPQHDFAFPAAAGVLARATEEAAISAAAQTRLIATAFTFRISRIS